MSQCDVMWHWFPWPYNCSTPGIHGLYRGAVPNAQRAAIVNGVQIPTYDVTKRNLLSAGFSVRITLTHKALPSSQTLTYTILLTKTTAAQHEGALSYHRVRGLHFVAAVFAATVCPIRNQLFELKFTHIYLQKFVKIRISVCHKSLKVFFCECGFSYLVWQHSFFAMLSWGKKTPY